MEILCGSDVKCPENLKFLNKKNYVARAGIIPHLVDKDGTIFILLGVDKASNVLADLGGTTEKGETTLDTAIREFLEESRSVIEVELGNTNLIIVSNVISKTGKKRKQVLLFPKVDLNKYNVEIDKAFQETVPKNQYEDEMSKLEWIELENFPNIPDKDLSRSLREVKHLLSVDLLKEI